MAFKTTAISTSTTTSTRPTVDFDEIKIGDIYG